jgi:L-lactate utilization protein LutC
MDRAAFLSKVRQAAAQGRAYRMPTRQIPPRAGYCGGGSDLVARLAAEVNAVGGQATVVNSPAQAQHRLAELLDSLRPRSALCWEHELLERVGLGELLESRRIERLAHRDLAALPPSRQRERILAAEVGISSTTWAIAETGSMAVASQPGSERVASLLPPVYITLVEARQVLPDLFDLFEALEAARLENLSSNLTLITGPSKTGDIELTLTTGVHGPGVWHVIAMR